jgi:hypothetical protein
VVRSELHPTAFKNPSEVVLHVLRGRRRGR